MVVLVHYQHEVDGDNRRTDINSNVSGAILGKIWITVEQEKALVKVMHRLREKERRASLDSNSIVGQSMQYSSHSSSEASEWILVMHYINK